MIFCDQCGLQVANGTILCPRCGGEIEETSRQATELHSNDATSRSNDNPSSLIGISLGHFRIVERIGTDDVATVFKAYQPALDRYVAIKAFSARYTRESGFVKRFMQEVRSVAKLDHPNIVQIHDFGDQDDLAYIAMEYVEGGTLKNRLKNALPPAEAIDFVMQAAQGLDCAHHNNIVHREVKPENMLVRKGGHLLLSDFGIAKFLEGTTNLIIAGTDIDTLQYMSPEQGEGAAQLVDHRSDIYSLGIVFFHCLTGHVPFIGDNPVDIAVMQMNYPLPVEHLATAGVSAPIIQVVQKMTAKDPLKRYQSMQEVINEITRVTSRSSLLNKPKDLKTVDAQKPGIELSVPSANVSASVPQGAPSPQTTLVVLLGASQWPSSPDLHSSKAFTNSASELKAYLLDSQGFGLSAENLLNLFDADQSADDIDSAICNFLDQRMAKMKTSGDTARDLLVYYVGHGGFDKSGSNYHLAIRRTRSNNPSVSSIKITDLACTLKEKARRLRRLLILDCCFSAKAFQSFQSAPDEAAVRQTIDAFQEKSKSIGYPQRGTALLCSSGANDVSRISQDDTYTMFTKALLNALITGNPRQQTKSHLSLRELNMLTIDFLTDLAEGNAPQPHLHSPDQSEGDVADIPFFPNLSSPSSQRKTAIRTCSHCGAELPRTGKFCGACGKRL